jgi:dTDP-4-dehydrorhamnose reductase
MRIAVAGASGLLGSELRRQLAGEAVPLARPEFDLTNAASVCNVLEELQPDAVINAAAYTDVDRAEAEPDLCRRINVEGVTALVEACRRIGCPLVQISTDYVFGGSPAPDAIEIADRAVPYREADTPTPRGVYAASKRDAELIAAEYPRHLIVRTAGLFGPTASTDPSRPGRRRHFVETMLALGRQRGSLRVVADQRLSPSYTPHVARAILWLLRSSARGTYHVVNGGEATWLDLAAETFRLANLDVALTPITAAEYAALAPRPRYSVLDCGKYTALGGPPLPSWQGALAEYLRR